MWFNNHSRETSGTKRKAKLLQLGPAPKKVRLMQAWQAYSQLYFNERVKPTLEARWDEYKLDLEAGIISAMPTHLAVLREVTTSILAAESDEVKEKVEKYRRDLKAGVAVKNEDPDINAESSNNPEEADASARAKLYLE